MEAVKQLTTRWVLIVDTDEGPTQVWHDPLVDQLQAAVGVSVSDARRGRSELASIPINLLALSRLERLEAEVNAWLRAVSRTPVGDLKNRILTLNQTADDLYRSGGLDVDTRDDLHAVILSWPPRIWEVLDPSTVKELLGSCPTCGVEKISTPDGDRWALRAQLQDGKAPIVECGACSAVWATTEDFLRISYHLRATVDVDALREFGIAA